MTDFHSYHHTLLLTTLGKRSRDIDNRHVKDGLATSQKIKSRSAAAKVK